MGKDFPSQNIDKTPIIPYIIVYEFSQTFLKGEMEPIWRQNIQFVRNRES